jgi:flagellar assembly factor FliW
MNTKSRDGQTPDASATSEAAVTKIESPRFGTLVVEPSRIIEFPRGLVGMEDCTRYSLFHPEGDNPDHFILQSLDDAAVAFHIADPAKFGFNHEITLSDQEAEDLGLTDSDRDIANSVAHVVVVVILTKESASQPVRANLNAPLIINLETRRGLQHVFAHLDFNLRGK